MTNVLIVDDNQQILEALELLLSIQGFTVKTLLSPDDIFSQIKLFHPNIILLDLLLPTMNGDVVTKKLKENNITKDIPVIIISAHMNARKIAFNAGADAFIPKPFTTKDLLVQVNSLTEKTKN